MIMLTISGCKVRSVFLPMESDTDANKSAFLKQLEPLTQTHYWLLSPDVHRPQMIRILSDTETDTCDIYLVYKGESDSIAFYTRSVDAYNPESQVTHMTDIHGSNMRIHFFGFNSVEDLLNRKFVTIQQFNTFQWYLALALSEGSDPSKAFKYAEQRLLFDLMQEVHGREGS